jgi:hypothetical protein
MHGTPSWHPTTISNVVKLQRIQNRVSRYIFGKKFSHELDKKILSVDSSLKFTDILYFYRCFINIIDCSLAITVRGGRSIKDGNDTHKLVPPFARMSMYQNGFVCRSVVQWNNLPSNVKNLDYSLFKNTLKFYMLNNP